MADFYRGRFDFLLGRFDSLGGRFDFRVGRFDPDTLAIGRFDQPPLHVVVLVGLLFLKDLFLNLGPIKR